MENRNRKNIRAANELITGMSIFNNVVVSVDFRNKMVKEVTPVCLNQAGECTNEDQIMEDLELNGCAPRKLAKQALPNVYDTDTIIVFDQWIA